MIFAEVVKDLRNFHYQPHPRPGSDIHIKAFIPRGYRVQQDVIVDPLDRIAGANARGRGTECEILDLDGEAARRTGGGGRRRRRQQNAKYRAAKPEARAAKRAVSSHGAGPGVMSLLAAPLPLLSEARPVQWTFSARCSA